MAQFSEIILTVALLMVSGTFGELQVHHPDILFNPTKNAIFAGGMIRIKSAVSDCWLDIRKKTYRSKYKDGRPSADRPVAGCTPVYPEKLNPSLNLDIQSFQDWQLYEQEGPFFEVVPPGQEELMLTGFGDKIFTNNSIIQLEMDKSFYSRLEMEKFSAPVDKNLYQVTSDVDDFFVKKEFDWKVIIVKDDENDNLTWRPRQKFQLFNINKKAFLGITGNMIPSYLVDNLKEVAGYPLAKMTSENYINTLWIVDRIRFRSGHECGTEEGAFSRFYGYGDVKNNEKKDQKIAYSYEDMKALYAKELNVVAKLLDIITDKELDDTLLQYDASVDIIKHIDINHPVDMFNLLKRMSLTWRHIQQKTSDKRIKKLIADGLERYYQDWNIAMKIGAMGLMDIQAYHGLDPSDIISGRIRYGDRIYQSKTKLSSEDVKLIANEAKKSKRLNVQVQWLNQTVANLNQECIFETDTAIANCEISDKEKIAMDNTYIQATKEHDKALANWKKTLTEKILTFKDPINADAPLKAHEFRQHFEKEMESVCGNPQVLHTCRQFYQFDKIQTLCKDPNHTSPPKPDHVCVYLHYKDPYLKLGPFQLELLHSEPVIQVVHNFVYKKEKDLFSNEFEEKMMTSSQLDGNDSYKHSKCNAFISEYSTPSMIKISNRIELATSFNVFNPNYRFTAENYLLVNYVLGSLLESHLDNAVFPAQRLAGGTAFTAIMYLSDNVVGGKTIFPEVDVAVNPEPGAVLVFHTQMKTGNADYRMSHMACPVVYGSKMINNKLVNSMEQMHRLPCYANLTNKLYEPPHYHVDYSNPIDDGNILTA